MGKKALISLCSLAVWSRPQWPLTVSTDSIEYIVTQRRTWSDRIALMLEYGTVINHFPCLQHPILFYLQCIHFERRQLLWNCFASFWKRGISKTKEIAARGSNFFPFIVDPLSDGRQKPFWQLLPRTVYPYLLKRAIITFANVAPVVFITISTDTEKIGTLLNWPMWTVLTDVTETWKRIIAFITKTYLFKYTENFITPKNENFQIKNSDIFYCFCSKHTLWVLVRTASTRRF